MKLDRRGLLVLGAAAAGVVFEALSAERVAQADDAPDLLGKIAAARASLKTLVAPFTQERRIGLLATVVKSEGELTLVRPDRLRWELLPPDGIVYWIGPEGLAYATRNGGASVGREAAGRFAGLLGDLATFVGGDLEKLRARYDIRVAQQEEGVTLAATPRSEDAKKQLRSVELVFGPDLWAIRRITIEEKGGDRSVIRFGKATRDGAVDPARMTPPKGG